MYILADCWSRISFGLHFDISEHVVAESEWIAVEVTVCSFMYLYMWTSARSWLVTFLCRDWFGMRLYTKGVWIIPHWLSTLDCQYVNMFLLFCCLILTVGDSFTQFTVQTFIWINSQVFKYGHLLRRDLAQRSRSNNCIMCNNILTVDICTI